MTAIAATAPLRIALVGNPNSGKTALFNQLTGSRQKVANYTGVTVERKEGRLRAPSGREFAVLDLPGAYSLHPASLDEAITRDLCRGFYPGEAAPDVLLCVIDATNLRLHLRFAVSEQPEFLEPGCVQPRGASSGAGRPAGIDNLQQIAALRAADALGPLFAHSSARNTAQLRHACFQFGCQRGLVSHTSSIRDG